MNVGPWHPYPQTYRSDGLQKPRRWRSTEDALARKAKTPIAAARGVFCLMVICDLLVGAECALTPQPPRPADLEGEGVRLSLFPRRGPQPLCDVPGMPSFLQLEHLLADPSLEALHLDEACEALVGGARRPLAVGLHQGSHEFSTPFRSGGAGCSLPDASAPTRFCVQGSEAVLVGVGAGMELAWVASPSRRQNSDGGRAEGPQVCSW